MGAVRLLEALQYGMIGFGAILAILAYVLLYREQRKNPPRSKMLQAIYVFMGFAIVLALVGFASEYIENGPGRKAWEGTWDSQTPFISSIRIKFTQTSNRATGEYTYVGKHSQRVQGCITGQVSGNVLIGEWIELVNSSKLEGILFFVLAEGRSNFVGRYTRDWEGNRHHVWSGTTNNSVTM
jgi:hypothetical protein